MAHAIVLESVRKTFGTNVAVENLDLVVPRGALYGFIGPNGAGKTTTIRMIMSILFPDSGRMSVLDHPSALEAKDRIGYLPEERGVYKKMKVGAFLRHMGLLKGAGSADLKRKVPYWLERVELADVGGKRCDELSKGMQQKIQFIAAVIHEPDLLIFDEPFSGLDPVNMRLLRELIRAEHQRGATIIFSTHVMAQAEALCDHIVMLHRGRKVLDQSMVSIRTRPDAGGLLFEPLEADADPAPLRALAVVRDVTRSDGRYEIALHEGTDVARAMRDVVTALPAARIEVHRPTLEDIFVRLVRDPGTAAGTHP